MRTTDAVEIANAFTQRWLSLIDGDRNTVLSGAGACCVLAALLHGAGGDARAELQAATGVAPEVAAATVEKLLGLLAAGSGAAGGVGIWTRPDVVLDPDFLTALPSMVVDQLPEDLEELDRWAERMTGGIIDRFPATIDDDIRLALASVVAADVDWVDPFDPSTTPWNNDTSSHVSLVRTTFDPDSAAVIRSSQIEVSRVVVESTGSIDVHLVAASPCDPASNVLATAIDALGPTDNVTIVPGSALSEGDAAGCLEVSRRSSSVDGDQLFISLPAFEFSASHDLLEHDAHFGLVAAGDQTRSHFPGLAAEPLAVSQVVQDASVGFSDAGFRAAAVTFAAISAGAAPPAISHTPLHIDVRHDRPFGFLAVDRSTSLALFAGWVHDPPPLDPPGL